MDTSNPKKIVKKILEETKTLPSVSIPDPEVRDLEKLIDKSKLTIEDKLGVVHHDKSSQKIKKVFLKTLMYKGDLRRAAMEVGYNHNLAFHPSSIVKSPTWKALIDEYFPPETLLSKEKELWNQKDWRAWANSLDRIHKIRGSFVRKVDISIHGSEEFRQMKDDELRQIIDGEVEPSGNLPPARPREPEPYVEGEDRAGQAGAFTKEAS